MAKNTEELRALLRIGNEDCERLLQKAADAFSAGKFFQAQAILTGLTALTDDARPLKLLGSTLMQQRRHRAAAFIYRRALKLDPDDPYIIVALAELHLKSLRFDEALPLFKQLFALDPAGEHPAVNRGRQLVADYGDKLKKAGYK